MNIKHVKYFVSVSQQGSLSSASRAHGISVQAMSKAMSDLEKELGEELFVRTHQGISLTPFGKAFCVKAQEVCEAFHDLETMADLFDEEPTKVSLFLCAPAFLHNARARAAMSAFYSSKLGMETDVSIGSGEKGMQALRTGRCDALITIGTLEDPDVDCFVMGTVPAGACMAKNHPLAQSESITLQDLAPYTVLSSKTFDHFNTSVLVTYQNGGLLSPVVEPASAGEMPYLFYFKRSVCLMVNVAPLGEMMPFSVMVPFAEKDREAIPLCLISLKGAKTAAYRRMEQLARNHPSEGRMRPADKEPR